MMNENDYLEQVNDLKKQYCSIESHRNFNPLFDDQ